MPTPLPPREERLRHQGKMLNEIMRHKRDEVARRQNAVPAADLRALASLAPDPLDFAAVLRGPGVSLIAEIKRASPSRGLLCRDFDPVQLASVYAQGGASAISVLTDARFFQGQAEHVSEVKELLLARKDTAKIPVLRKDFIFDPYQIVEARVVGADALLLIAAVLGDQDLKRLLDETRRYGMEALVEVHDESEAARAVKLGARVIGVNNRDLRTFTVDLGLTERLRALVPPDRVLVSESGIHTAADVQRLAALGVDAMLVGESLVTARPEDRLDKVRSLVRAGRSR